MKCSIDSRNQTLIHKNKEKALWTLDRLAPALLHGSVLEKYVLNAKSARLAHSTGLKARPRPRHSLLIFYVTKNHYKGLHTNVRNLPLRLNFNIKQNQREVKQGNLDQN